MSQIIPPSVTFDPRVAFGSKRKYRAFSSQSPSRELLDATFRCLHISFVLETFLGCHHARTRRSSFAGVEAYSARRRLYPGQESICTFIVSGAKQAARRKLVQWRSQFNLNGCFKIRQRCATTVQCARQFEMAFGKRKRKKNMTSLLWAHECHEGAFEGFLDSGESQECTDAANGGCNLISD